MILQRPFQSVNLIRSVPINRCHAALPACSQASSFLSRSTASYDTMAATQTFVIEERICVKFIVIERRLQAV